MTDKKPRQYKKGEFAVFKSHAEKLGLSARELAEQCGYERTSAHGWETSGKCPQAAVLAAEGLVRRLGKTTRRAALIVQVDSAKERTVRDILTALGATITELKLE